MSNVFSFSFERTPVIVLPSVPCSIVISDKSSIFPLIPGNKTLFTLKLRGLNQLGAGGPAVQCACGLL